MNPLLEVRKEMRIEPVNLLYFAQEKVGDQLVTHHTVPANMKFVPVLAFDAIS
jgi:hypothetical protein